MPEIKNKSYNTDGKKAVISLLAANKDRQMSAEEIFSSLVSSKGNQSFADAAADQPKIPGKSSVYRLLLKLEDESLVKKFRTDDGVSLYQYIGEERDCEHHFHLRCTDCGVIVHLDCPKSEELLAHLLRDHGFSVDSGRSILYGRCSRCAAALARHTDGGENADRKDDI